MAGAKPKGAEELLIAIQTPSPKGNIGIPALIWGNPGEGKSSFVESLSKEGFPVVTLIASIHDPTDFSGLPFHREGRVQFAPPDWSFAFDETGKGILFLDELTTAPPSVQAALLRVVLERKIGFRELPKGVRVVAAANPTEIAAGGWELSPPLRNRFVHICWALNSGEYIKALQEGFARPELPEIDPSFHEECEGYWRMMVAEFLKRNPNLVKTEPSEEEYAFASPRAWDYAIALMTSCDLLDKAPSPGRSGSEAFFNLVAGCVGRGAATAFAGFLKSLRLPDPDEVLDGKLEVSIKGLRDDELYVLFSTMATELVKREQRKPDGFVDAMLVFLELAERVSRDRRSDVVLAPIRKVAKDRLLHQALLAAQKTGKLSEMQRAINRVFEEMPLKEFHQAVA